MVVLGWRRSRGSLRTPHTADVSAVFDGVDVPVSENWRIELGGLPILGGYDDKTAGDDSLPANAPTLKVNATAVFGGVKLASEPSCPSPDAHRACNRRRSQVTAHGPTSSARGAER